VVEDGLGVDLDPLGGHRDLGALRERRQVVQVVVDVRVDLLLHPGGGVLEQPQVLEGVDAELQHVVVLVRHGHPQRVDRGAREAPVVVVEHEVGVATRALLLGIGRGVAVELLAQVRDVNVDLALGADAVARAALPVGLRPRPTEGVVLDGVGEPHRLLHVVDERVRDRGVPAAVGPVDAEVGVASRGVGCLLAEESAIALVGGTLEQVESLAAIGAFEGRQSDREVAKGDRGVAIGRAASGELHREGGAGGLQRVLGVSLAGLLGGGCRRRGDQGREGEGGADEGLALQSGGSLSIRGRREASRGLRGFTAFDCPGWNTKRSVRLRAQASAGPRSSSG
jgi:hypothetical protein